MGEGSGGTPPAKAKHLKNSYASETPVTDGERVYVYFANLGLFALRLRRQAALVQTDRSVQDAQQLGHRCVAGPSSTTASTSSTTTTSSRSWRPTTRGRARRSGASSARRAPTGRRHSCGRTSCAPRSSRPAPIGSVLRSVRKAAVGVFGDVDDLDPDALRALRPALHQLGLHRRSDAAGVCDSSRRVGRHLVETRRDEQRIHRLVVADRRPYNPTPIVYGDTTTRFSTAGSSPATTRARARRFIHGSESRARRADSPRRPGPTTARSSR